MIGTQVLIDIRPENLERIQKRESWPVALLAPLLASKSTIYRLVGAGILECDGHRTPRHVLTSSIIEAHRKSHEWLG